MSQLRACVLLLALTSAATAQDEEGWHRVWAKPSRASAVAITAAGDKVIAVLDGELAIWDADTGELEGSIEGARGSTLAYGPKGTLALTAKDEVRLWSSLALEPRVLEIEHASKGAWFSADESLFACAGYDFSDDKKPRKFLLVVDVAKGKTRHRIELDAMINGAAFSPDGAQVVTAGQDGSVGVYDTQSGKLQRTLKAPTPKTCLSGVAYLPGGVGLVTSDFSRNIMLWNLASGEVIKTIPALQKVQCMTLGKVLATGHWGGAVRLWDLQKGEKVGEIPLPKSVPGSLCLSADGKRVAFHHGIMNPSVELWIKGKPPEPPKREGPWTGTLTEGASSLAFAADGKLLFAVGGSGFKVWDLESGATPSGKSLGHPLDFMRFVAVSPAKELVVAGEKKVRVVTLGEKVSERSFELEKKKEKGYGNLGSVALGPKGELLVVLRDTGQDVEALELWDLKKGKLKKTLAKGELRGKKVAIDGKGKRVALSTFDGVQLYSVRGKKLGQLEEVEAAAGLSFSPDGGHLVAIGGRFQKGRVSIVSLKTGREVRGVKIDPKPQYSGFSADGKRVAVVDCKGNLHAVDLGGLFVYHTEEGVAGESIDQVGIAFSPDQKRLAIGSTEQGRIRILSLEKKKKRR